MDFISVSCHLLQNEIPGGVCKWLKKSKEASPMILEHVQLSNVYVCAGLEICLWEKSTVFHTLERSVCWDVLLKLKLEK